MNQHYKKISLRGFHEILSLFLIISIIFGTFYYQPRTAQAATYTFTQTSWTGGATANTAVHPTNQTGWTQFSTSTSGISVSSTVSLASSTYSFTDDGATSTTSGSATGGGFANGTNSTTTVSGSGSGASVALASSTTYATSGIFTSATIDMGLTADFSTLTWNPTTQPASSSIQFQVAANNDNSIWDYQDVNQEDYPSGVTVHTSYIRQNCTGYSPCYNSLSAWEAAQQRNLVTSNEIEVAKIDGAWTAADTTSVTIDGWTTDATHYIKIYTTAEARHQGKWDETKYRLIAINNSGITIYESYVRVDGLQIQNAALTSDWLRALIVDSTVAGGVTGVRISNNIIKEGGGGSYRGGIRVHYNVSHPVYIWNNIIYDFSGIGGFGIDLSMGFGTGPSYVFNNTVVNNTSCIVSDSTSIKVVNNITQNCSDGFVNAFAAGSNYNISDLASDAPGANSKNSTTVNFVSTSTKDFHLASNDTAAKDSGTDLSADANLAVTTDIEGHLRSTGGVWDIGAHEYGATGANIPGSLDGNRYFRYKSFLSTSDTAYTPSLNDITINYAQYPTSAELTSSIYDTADAANVVSSIAWSESLATSTDVKFQIRTSANGSAWSGWCGPDDGTASSCSSSTYFTNPAGGETIDDTQRDGSSDRYIQYKAFLTSGGVTAPTFSSVTITYVINVLPDFDSSFGTGGVSVSQNTTDTDYDSDSASDIGEVLLIYLVRDTDTNSGTINPGKVQPYFEYRLNASSSWTAIATSSLNTGAYSLKNVSQSAYTSTSTTVNASTTTALWDAVGQLGTSIYSTTTQIRVRVNDNEAANNIASSTSAVFTLDTKLPTGTLTIDSSISGNTLYLNFTDDANISYRISNSQLTSTSTDSWTAVGAATASTSVSWSTLIGSPNAETVYFQVKDIYGNTLISSAVAPGIGSANQSSIYIKDTSNVSTSQWREFISWTAYTATTTGAAFSAYQIYRSTDGTSYSQIGSVNSSSTNYYTDSSVSSSTTYYYKVRILDTDGDISDFSASVNDYVDGQGGTDVTAPVISNVTSTVYSTWAQITWTADEISDSTVEYSIVSGSYTSSTSVNTLISTSTLHSVYLTGLVPSTTYYYRVKSTDIFSNVATNDNSGTGYSFTTSGGPQISNVSCSEVTDNSAVVFWNTTTDSNSQVDYSTSASLANATSVSSGMVGTSTAGYYQHKITLSSLTQGATYYFRVQSTDGSSNTVIDNNSGAFYQCRTTRDTQPPVISNISTPVITDTAVVIIWTTNEKSTSQVEYGLSSAASGSYTTSTTRDNTLTINHVVTLTGLTKETQYYYRVKSYDMNPDSPTAVSSEQTFTTAAEKQTVIVYVASGGGGGSVSKEDKTAPVISGISIDNFGAFEAVVNFLTDEQATAFVLYGPNQNYGLVDGSTEFNTSHGVKLSGLRMGTDYNFKVKAIDKAGNYSYSDNQTFKTKYFAEALKDLATLENASQFQEAIEKSIESILPSILPPFIEKPRVSEITENSAIIKWTTNIPAYSVISYASESDYLPNDEENPYAAEISDITEKKDSHEIKIVGLLPNTKYHFMAKSFVLPQVVGESADMTFVTKAPKIAPRVIDIDKDAIRIVWTTGEKSTSIAEYKNLRTGDILRKTDEKMVVDHDARLENLDPGTSYEIKVSGYNEKGNLVEAGEALTVKTSRDITPPEISNIRIDGALVPGRTDRVQTVISWRTDEPANSAIEYEEGSGKAGEELANKISETNTFTDIHTVIIAKLKPGTLYRVKIISVDEAGNKTISPIRTIITPRQSESIVDVIVKNFEETFQFLRKLR